MSQNDWFVSYVFLWLITNSGVVLSRQYYIREGQIPSYMYRKFDNVEEKIFPSFITINVSVSSPIGTLLYSIDKNMNQLIVTLRDNLLSEPPYGIEVELNKQYMVVSLSQLCKCNGHVFDVRCLLTLRIMIINSYLTVICNCGKGESFKINEGKDLNRNYPILYSTNNSNVILINEAHMWLVNHPPIDNTLPNPYQMYGCIFNVYYNNKLIAFTNVSSNISNKCIKSCFDYICNGGQCHVYYSEIPICNCTKTFLNGQFCNDSIQSMNIRADSLRSSFKMIKLSWMSYVNKIFELKNEYIRIALVRKYDNLFFEYRYTERGKISKSVTLSEHYVANTESIFIVYFYEKVIDIRLYNNKLWLDVSIPFPIDLSTQQFDSIILQSGQGTMDLVHKNHMDNEWTKLIFLKSKTLEEGMDVNKIYLIIGVTMLALVLVVTLAIGIIIYRKRMLCFRTIMLSKDRKCIDKCKKNLGWHIIEKSLTSSQEWIDYIIPKMVHGTLTVYRLETMYDILKEAKHFEYSMAMAVLFIHARIFVLPKTASLSDEDNKSFDLLVTLLRDRDTDKLYFRQHSIYRLKYLLEPMMDCLEDVSDRYSDNDSIHPLIDALIPFVAYWIIVHPYTRSNTSFRQSYLCGDKPVKLWATALLCYYGDGCTYLDKLSQYVYYLKEYLITVEEVSEDVICIYAALIRGAASKDIQWTLTDFDFRIIDGINKREITLGHIRNIIDNIIKLFIDKYKDGIIKGCNGNTALTEDQQLVIKRFSVSLKNASFDTYDKILSFLDELYPPLTNNNNNDNIAVMEDLVVSIIDYLDKYRRNQSESIKEKTRCICHKYLSNGSVSDKIKESLSNITKNDNINKSVIIPHIINATDVPGSNDDMELSSVRRSSVDTPLLPYTCDTVETV